MQREGTTTLEQSEQSILNNLFDEGYANSPQMPLRHAPLPRDLFVNGYDYWTVQTHPLALCPTHIPTYRNGTGFAW
ncbi:hypothetical protein PAPYR_9235 [Paratrimastix pyriformis]|uniref:Uncharacterized protein n=1 Tax=Paratrimastix pyriformis TaxID=342808 RepID=A0ABQ8U8V0_9EUKA|nr:hypothetical protein PAPYR_9235 [Paratrimastix pyriformis]